MKKLILSILLTSFAFAGCKKDMENASDTTTTITGIAPSSGNAGMVVTISGTNFGTSVANIIVAFNGVSATVQSVTPTTIKVIVPVTISGIVMVGVGNPGVGSFSYFSYTGPVFTYNGPFATVTGISPSTVSPDMIAALTGTNFGTSVTAVKVLFNGVQAIVQSVTPTEIKVVVPVTTSGTVTGTVGNQSITGPAFTYYSPLTDAYVNGDVRLITQAQVDTFAALNKGKQLQITGNLTIGGSDVTNLSGLSIITSISSKLTVGNTSVIDLSGFSSLKSLGSLTLASNTVLNNLHGLEQLTNLTAPEILDPSNTGGYIQLRTSGIALITNPKLTSIAALQNVTIASIIDISGNASLNDLCPLKGPIIDLSTQPGHPYLTGIYTVTLPALTLTNNGNYATTKDALAAVALCK